MKKISKQYKKTFIDICINRYPVSSFLLKVESLSPNVNIDEIIDKIIYVLFINECCDFVFLRL